MLLWIMLRGVCEYMYMTLELGPWMGSHFPSTPGAYSHLFKVDGGSRSLELALRFEYFLAGCIDVP